MAERGEISCFECLRDQRKSVNCPQCRIGKCHTQGERERVVVDNPTPTLDGSEQIRFRLRNLGGRLAVHKE